MSKISIYANGVWAGEGRFLGGKIVDCPAVLGGSQDASDEIYESIEDAIAAGDESDARDGDGIMIDGVSYSWDIVV